MTPPNLLVLGSRYRDTVSGWEGIATARYEYMNGCVRVEISGADKDGKPESFVFDIQQVEWVDERGSHEWPINEGELRPTGGPRTNRPVTR